MLTQPLGNWAVEGINVYHWETTLFMCLDRWQGMDVCSYKCKYLKVGYAIGHMTEMLLF
jgi:hypothetical protein